MKFKDVTPRYFRPSTKGQRKTDKRPEHVMLIGGRDGEAVAMLPPRDPRYWSEGAKGRWTEELEKETTYADARTQPRLLREVRPEQRLYAKGYMKVSDMGDLLARNLARQRPRPILVELTLRTQDDELLALPMEVSKGVVFTGLLPTSESAALVGAPLTWQQGEPQDQFTQTLAAAAEFGKLRLPNLIRAKDASGRTKSAKIVAPEVKDGIFVAMYSGGESSDPFFLDDTLLKKVRVIGTGKLSEVTLASGQKRNLREATPGERFAIPVADLVSLSLLTGFGSDIQDTPYFSRLFGIQGDYQGQQRIFPFFLVARLRVLRQAKVDRPAPQISQFLGDVTKTAEVREKAARHLRKFAETAWARAVQKGGLSNTDPWNRVLVDPITGLRMVVTPEKELFWADLPVIGGTAEGFDAVALLRPLYPGDEAILVNVDDYLGLARLREAIPEPPKGTLANPRGGMRTFSNAVHYLSQQELAMLAKLKKTTPEQILASEPRVRVRGGKKGTKSNPFQKVTEPGPGKIQVTSKRGKTLYMTPNQIAAMGSKMLAPGETERALSRSNPKRRYVATTGGSHQYIPGGDEDSAEDIAIAYQHIVGKSPSMKHAQRAAAGFGPGVELKKLRPGERVFQVTLFDEYDQRPYKIILMGKPAEVRRRVDRSVQLGDRLISIEEVKPGSSAVTYENPRTFGGGMSGAQRGQFAKKRSQRRMDASAERAYRREDAEISSDVGGDEEAEFQKFMAQLGLKANGRFRRNP